jgi:hypothetical protein
MYSYMNKFTGKQLRLWINAARANLDKPWAQGFLGKLLHLSDWGDEPTDCEFLAWESDLEKEGDYVKEFNFCLLRIDWDKQGLPVPKTEFTSRGHPTFIINGALINHGTVPEPNWSIHT